MRGGPERRAARVEVETEKEDSQDSKWDEAKDGECDEVGPGGGRSSDDIREEGVLI